MRVSIQYLLPNHKADESDIMTIHIEGRKIKDMEFYYIRKKHGIVETTPCKATIIQSRSDENHGRDNATSTIKPDGTAFFELDKPGGK